MNSFTDPMPGSWPAPERAAGDAGPRPVCVIAGLGNCLLGDDGFGVHAARRLLADPPADALVVEVGVDVFSAISWLERSSRVLAIDALEAGGAPGTLYRCDAREIRGEGIRASLHELGLLAMLEFIPRDRWPEIHILGVQPAVIAYGLELSPALQAALPRAVAAAREIVGSWRQAPPPAPPGRSPKTEPMMV